MEAHSGKVLRQHQPEAGVQSLHEFSLCRKRVLLCSLIWITIYCCELPFLSLSSDGKKSVAFCYSCCSCKSCALHLLHMCSVSYVPKSQLWGKIKELRSLPQCGNHPFVTHTSKQVKPLWGEVSPSHWSGVDTSSLFRTFVKLPRWRMSVHMNV